MLVLSRQEGSSIRIGDSVEVVVLEISGGRVRLGISAPREVPVLRKELCEGPTIAQPVSAARPRAEMVATCS